MAALILTNQNIRKVYESIVGHTIETEYCMSASDAWENFENSVVENGGISYDGIFYPMGQ